VCSGINHAKIDAVERGPDRVKATGRSAARQQAPTDGAIRFGDAPNDSASKVAKRLQSLWMYRLLG
jgi:hypothetical protein